MWPLNIIFPSGRTWQLMPRHLWLVAAVIATIGVFAAYVSLISGSVERGAAQWRAVQEAGPAPAAAPTRNNNGSPARRRPAVAG